MTYNILVLVKLEVAPCNKKGKEYTETDDMFVDSPEELVGKEVHFWFKIVNCRGLPNKYTVGFSFRRGDRFESRPDIA